MITKETDTRKIQEIFYNIFCSQNPFEAAGSMQMANRVVIFPTNGYHLDEDQYQALIGAISDCGEEYFYISEVEHIPNPFLTERHWKCLSPTYSDYSNLPVCVENAIYSAQGNWGILISHEDHALLVSQDLFWESFRGKYSSVEKDYSQFLEFWRKNEKDFDADVSWMKIFLAHLTLPSKSEVDY